ncbi:MAG: 3-hydroxyacyl-CoA dehydrogenase family protein [Deltaproteobacteria bacterium]|nr:3-hydroxyacyl-CoA dehydrogenase family protein [Deltaproteobacteria bacterium]
MKELKIKDIKRIVVIGAGLMGSQIAELMARFGKYRVTLVDIKDEFVKKGISGIEERTEKFFVAKGKMTPEERKEILSLIGGATDMDKAAATADFVLEAATENIGIKKDLFHRVDQSAPEHVIFASNTSYLSITEIASAANRPDRFVGMHFFNPVGVMKLVEIVKGARTSENTVEVTSALAKILQKEPVPCQDSFGFLANRAYIALRMEAVQMLWERVAPPAEIDKALKLGYNLPMGPLELGDMGGSWSLYASSEEDRIRELGEKGRLHPLLRLMARAGYTGGAGKKGIYDFYTEVLSKW